MRGPAALRQQRRGGGAHAGEVAGEHEVEGVVGERLRQPAGLQLAQFVERHVELTLEAADAIPVGFTVAHKSQFGHRKPAFMQGCRGYDATRCNALKAGRALP